MSDETPSSDIRSISQVLDDLHETLPRDRISVANILDALHERGFGFLLFIFALPAALPIPGLGINTLIATPLFFLTTQQMIGRETIWLPQRILNKTVSRGFFENVIHKSMPYVKKIEWFLKPRLGAVTQGVFSNFIGLAGLIMALSVTIPLPLTNTVPSFGIAVMALGVIMRDGLAVIMGAVVGLTWVAMLVCVSIFLGAEGFELIKETIHSYL